MRKCASANFTASASVHRLFQSLSLIGYFPSIIHTQKAKQAAELPVCTLVINPPDILQKW